MRIILTILLVFTFLFIHAQDLKTGCAHAKNQGYNFRVNENELLNHYDVKYYGLNVSIDNLSAYIDGYVDIKSQVIANTLNTFVVELINEMDISSVKMNDQELAYVHEGDEVLISLTTPLSKNDIFDIRIYYSGNANDAGYNEGISTARSNTWNNQITWTLSEPLHAKEWWPTKQVLADKADSAQIFITVPDNLKAGSNGILKNVVDLPDNKKRFEWKTNYPIAYYLISLTAGQYVEYNTFANVDGFSPILIQNYIYDNPECLPYYKDDLDEVASLLELFSDKFGVYPFNNEKYGHAMAPFGGGMEHQTMTTLGIFNLTLDAHELAHQWFGNNVTCASWQDIWINEGFARYSEYLALEFLRSKSEADSWIAKEYSDVKNDANESVYVPENLAESDARIFDFTLTYQKGGILVHMIRNIINNDQLFFETLKDYQSVYTDSTATGDDFRKLLEGKTDLEFEEFFNDWYYGKGYPIYDNEWGYFGDTLYIQHKQTTSINSTSLFEMPLEYKVKFAEGDSIIRITQTTNNQNFQIYFDQEVVGLEADPNKWMIKSLSLEKTISKPNEVTAIDNVDYVQKQFSIFPNPTKDQITITNKQSEVVEILITDLNGRRIYEDSFYTDKHSIQIPNVKKGVYLIKLSNQYQTYTQKIIMD